MVTKFGSALESRGFRLNDKGSLESALDALVNDGIDSDRDGAKDIDELLSATDPNSADNASIASRPSARGGCTMRASPGGSSAWAAVAAIAASALLVRRPRARRVTTTAVTERLTSSKQP